MKKSETETSSFIYHHSMKQKIWKPLLYMQIPQQNFIDYISDLKIIESAGAVLKVQMF